MFANRTNWKLTPNRLTQAVETLRSSNIPILDLTASNPTQCGFHYDQHSILSAFHNPTILNYDPQSKGLPFAREAVAAYYRADHNTPVAAGSICLTTSTSEGYSYVFRLLCNPGDEILVPKPSYPLFEFLADLQDVSLVPYSLEYADGWFIDFQSLENAITPRTRAILLVHPNNPTGSYIHGEETRRLNKICDEKNLALIVDEVFLDYSFTSANAKSFAANHDALTFTLSGLSKIAALPQMKAAWIITTGPQTVVQPALDRLDVIADTYLSLSTPTQLAMPTLFEQRRDLQPQIRARVAKNLMYLQSQLAANPACQLLGADAGWYAVLRLPATHSDEDLAIALLEKHHTLIHPGHFYDFPAQNHIVLSLITPPSAFREGITHLLSLF